MRATIRHEYDCSAEVYWGELFFDPEYTERVYLDGLRFSKFAMTDTAQADGSTDRRLHVTPRLDAPRPVRALIGDALSYEERGRYVDGRYTAHIVPSRLADKLGLRLEQTVEALGDDRCARTVICEIDVRIFGLGRVFEGFIERTYRENYGLAADYTNRVWLPRVRAAGPAG